MRYTCCNERVLGKINSRVIKISATATTRLKVIVVIFENSSTFSSSAIIEKSAALCGS